VPDLFIEIKRDIPERILIVVPKVIEAVESRNLTSQVTMTSFDPDIIRLMKELRPSIRRGYIGNWDDPAMLATGEELGIIEADARMPQADPAIVAEAKSRGWRIGMWPCNSQEELELALTFDPDLICTDEPTKTWERYAKLRGSEV
jgi:glycerophosphoryl diester phosphodiesterase